jgi:hypothetical protein
MIRLHRQANLPELVQARGGPRARACRLHRGQEQRDEDSNDGDNHQQFNQRKRLPPVATLHGLCIRWQSVRIRATSVRARISMGNVEHQFKAAFYRRAMAFTAQGVSF